MYSGTWFTELVTNATLFAANYDREIEVFATKKYIRTGTSLAQVMCNVISTSNDVQGFITYTVCPNYHAPAILSMRPQVEFLNNGEVHPVCALGGM